MELLQCLFVKNRWYRSGATIPMEGIVVHSTGANNPDLKRYVQPATGQTVGLAVLEPDFKELSYYGMLTKLGTNTNGNDWNRASQELGVHAWVGKLAGGKVAAVQSLPWDSFVYGVGAGRNGSYNSSHIQFEICEDTTDAAYTREAYRTAAELCAYLCRAFEIPVEKIVSHNEAGRTGYGSHHVDPEHWWSLYGYTMDGFRQDVQRLLDGEEWEEPPMRYDNLKAMPDWARPTVEKLVNSGLLNGDGSGLNLSEDMVRLLVILDRAGNFEREGAET